MKFALNYCQKNKYQSQTDLYRFRGKRTNGKENNTEKCRAQNIQFLNIYEKKCYNINHQQRFKLHTQ